MHSLNSDWERVKVSSNLWHCAIIYALTPTLILDIK